MDGDTFWLGRMKVRLADIDTPEITDAKCASERQRGEAARDRLLALLNSREWELVLDGKDRYRRALGRLVSGNADAGAILVREGFARPYGGHRRPWC
ncbi:MAG: thermonuclease family protein [Rhizobiales bacterium]|nr:thermonuclease family protein [Hyphomicrobiales bacterium]